MYRIFSITNSSRPEQYNIFKHYEDNYKKSQEFATNIKTIIQNLKKQKKGHENN